MNHSFITFHRDGKQLHTSKLNGFPLVSFGQSVGQVQGKACFSSLTITTGGRRQRVVTPDDFRGPVTVCVETKGQPAQWFGLADSTATATVGRRHKSFQAITGRSTTGV